MTAEKAARSASPLVAALHQQCIKPAAHEPRAAIPLARPQWLPVADLHGGDQQQRCDHHRQDEGFDPPIHRPLLNRTGAGRTPVDLFW
jgi:hypothetical protein